jgi:hypothetical protein
MTSGLEDTVEGLFVALLPAASSFFGGLCAGVGYVQNYSKISANHLTEGVKKPMKEYLKDLGLLNEPYRRIFGSGLTSLIVVPFVNLFTHIPKRDYNPLKNEFLIGILATWLSLEAGKQLAYLTAGTISHYKYKQVEPSS